MKFDRYFPTERLRPYIKYFVISDDESEKVYKVYPSTGMVIGFQYRGRLAVVKDCREIPLALSGVTGISDTYKTFKNVAGTGTVLVCFTETGFMHFTSNPANELFNLSLSLDDIFDKGSITEVEEELASAVTDRQRISVVEQFLLLHLKEHQTDRLVLGAVKLIHQSKGAIRVKELNEKLFISPSPFEKRFRKAVGTTPKKFATIIRFNAVLDSLSDTRSLAEICYENNFFDQAHFIKSFKYFTGETPENFKRLS